MTAERADKPHVKVYLDDNPKPLIDRELPIDIALDTLTLVDGAHRLVVRASLSYLQSRGSLGSTEGKMTSLR